ncbi:MAG TPA: tRNA glutamyl-Q(34) synthetase GluQRS [Caldimonas sp.]|nr:tRNA glutamyl-Q(34) synthetase GluQRS [Caldimonas sp.]
MTPRYTGRFAPSPTGLLHAGSLVAALASWLDARANRGRWLIRIEDLDTSRNQPGAAEAIVGQLARCGLRADEPALRQSGRGAAYQAALDRLLDAGAAYPCGCSRRDIETMAVATAVDDASGPIYPGTCRDGLHGRPARSFRLRTAGDSAVPLPSAIVEWTDRRLGRQREDVARSVGDFVLRRADAVWAYQLAVVVDDAAQGVTDVVRGEDLAGSTARQIFLQRALGLPTPRWLHVPLILAADGQKLSKQTGARPLDLEDPVKALRAAGAVLDVTLDGSTVGEALANGISAWRRRWPLP